MHKLKVISLCFLAGLAEKDLKMPIPMEKLREMANRMNQILTNLLVGIIAGFHWHTQRRSVL